MSNQWLGASRIAIVPAFMAGYDDPPPLDWSYRVMSRVFYDPQPGTGLDRSLQNYIQTASSGRASIVGDVFPAVWSQDADTVGTAMRSLPANHGYSHILVVLPHSVGLHRSGHAAWDFSPLNGITGWARVAMYNNMNLTQPQAIGVWAMEVLHIKTDLMDLYNVDPHLDRYDVMANAGASSHPSAHTKRIFGWVPPGAVRRHHPDITRYNLHAVALPQPPPPDRVTAVEILARNSASHFLVEARRNVDQYERSDALNDGIPQEGVIIYQVQSETNVYLHTFPALLPGQSYVNAPAGFEVRIANEIPGGYAVEVITTPNALCPSVLQEIQALEDMYENESDPWVRRQIRVRLGRLRYQARQQGCL